MAASIHIAEEERHPVLIHLTYISDSCISVQDQAKEIALLVHHARRSNKLNGITGALLFTGKRFVQTLEGTAVAVDKLMARISRDKRHEAVVFIDRHEVSTRIFNEWSLAYSGPSVSLARLVERALKEALGEQQYDVSRLLRLIQEFGRPGR